MTCEGQERDTFFLRKGFYGLLRTQWRDQSDWIKQFEDQLAREIEVEDDKKLIYSENNWN